LARRVTIKKRKAAESFGFDGHAKRTRAGRAFGVAFSFLFFSHLSARRRAAGHMPGKKPDHLFSLLPAEARTRGVGSPARE
jgi:hypothetical protein